MEQRLPKITGRITIKDEEYKNTLLHNLTLKKKRWNQGTERIVRNTWIYI
jgi:hypothetical protein